MTLFFFIFWVVICSIVGAMIGQKKHRIPEGVALGLFFGPLGWLVMAVAKSHGQKCPACKGDVEDGATKCKHCGSAIPAVAHNG